MENLYLSTNNAHYCFDEIYTCVCMGNMYILVFQRTLRDNQNRVSYTSPFILSMNCQQWLNGPIFGQQKGKSNRRVLHA